MNREPTQEEAAGMTVNERLWLFGLWNAFEKAIEENDRPSAEDILEKIYLTHENIQIILDKEIRLKS